MRSGAAMGSPTGEAIEVSNCKVHQGPSTTRYTQPRAYCVDEERWNFLPSCKTMQDHARPRQWMERLTLTMEHLAFTMERLTFTMERLNSTMKPYFGRS